MVGPLPQAVQCEPGSPYVAGSTLMVALLRRRPAVGDCDTGSTALHACVLIRFAVKPLLPVTCIGNQHMQKLSAYHTRTSKHPLSVCVLTACRFDNCTTLQERPARGFNRPITAEDAPQYVADLVDRCKAAPQDRPTAVGACWLLTMQHLVLPGSAHCC